MKGIFPLDVVERVEHELGDVSESGGVARRDAVLSEGGEEFAEDEVDVGGGQELPGDGGSELGAEALGFEELQLFASVEKTKGGMIVVAGQTAAASVGGLVGAALDGG